MLTKEKFMMEWKGIYKGEYHCAVSGMINMGGSYDFMVRYGTEDCGNHIWELHIIHYH